MDDKSQNWFREMEITPTQIAILNKEVTNCPVIKTGKFGQELR